MLTNFRKIAFVSAIALAMGVTTISCHKEVESVTIGPATAEVVEGATLKMVAYIIPEKAEKDAVVTWSVNDETLATIDNSGNLKAFENGKVVVTVNADGKTNTREVTIKNSVLDHKEGVFFTENFNKNPLLINNELPFNNWRTLTLGEGNGWVYDNTIPGSDLQTGMMVSLAPGENVQTDNWLLLPKLWLNGNAELDFEIRATGTVSYEIWISKTNAKRESFEKVGLATSTPTITNDIRTIFQSLQGYTGNCIIAFRHIHKNAYGSAMHIDNVAIENRL